MHVREYEQFLTRNNVVIIIQVLTIAYRTGPAKMWAPEHMVPNRELWNNSPSTLQA